MKKIILIMSFVASAVVSVAQVFSTRSCKVTFFSVTTVENIDGVNDKSKALADLKSGTVAIKLSNSQFQFKSAFMQEHFNENYMESEKYPYSGFTGKIKGDIDLSKPGTYTVDVKGNLDIHGVSLERTIPVTITVIGADNIKVDSKFKVKIADHKIKVPALVGQSIAEEMDVAFVADMIPFVRK